jgi:hypothetical protein
MHLRQAIYEHLLKSERLAEEAISYYSGGELRRVLVGFDYDGQDKLLIKTPRINLYIDPADGGTLFEFDIKEPGLERNIQDTMTRYREPYLEGCGVNPDCYRRVSWRLHVWSVDTTIRDWLFNTPFKDVSDLALLRHHVALAEDPRLVYLRGVGGFYSHGARVASILVKKAVRGEST